jgi:cobalamin synthase
MLMSQVQTRTAEMSQTASSSEAQSTATQSKPKTNRLAIWALVLSILTLGGVGSILGMVFGVKARHHVERSGERGFGLATAAVVVGVLTLLFATFYWIVIAQHFGGGSGGSGSGGGGY